MPFGCCPRFVLQLFYFLYNCNLKFIANTGIWLSKVNKNLGELLINTCNMIVHIAFKSLFFGTGHIT